jgi:hypothetical protein
MAKQKKLKTKKKKYQVNAKPQANERPKFNFTPWVLASIVIFLIVLAAHKEYISSLVSQILLVLTVVVFSVYQRTRKKNE